MRALLNHKLKLFLAFIGLTTIAILIVINDRAEAVYAVTDDRQARFNSKLKQLAEKLTIDGLAYAVIQDGRAIASSALTTNRSKPLTPQTPLRFASNTKALTAVALMQAIEAGRLSLDQAVTELVPSADLLPTVTVRHLATHTSEGKPNADYVYATNRYALLEEVLKVAYSEPSLETIFKSQIIGPAGMRWHDSPFLGAHAGLISTVDDMAKFVGAVQTNALLRAEVQTMMFSPHPLDNGSYSPSAIGWFSQTIGNDKIVWSFGQDDPDHSSSLILLVPDRNIGLVVLANTDELSNPYRLLMGDGQYSPFLQAFLDAYAPEIGVGISNADRMITGALSSVWTGDFNQANAIFEMLKAKEPAVFEGADNLVLHFLVARLSNKDNTQMDSFDDLVIGKHPHNRWALFMSANYRATVGDTGKAKQRYEDILAPENQHNDFLWTLFQAWSYTGLARIEQAANPERALEYVEQGLATGVTGPTRADLEKMKETLSRR